jgi:hypothetical protein
VTAVAGLPLPAGSLHQIAGFPPKNFPRASPFNAGYAGNAVLFNFSTFAADALS